MNKKVHTLFLTLTIVAGLSLLSEVFPVGLSEVAHATPGKGDNCAACHGSKKAKESKDTKGFTVDFMPGECDGFSNTGENPFFILNPGYQLVLEGTDKKGVVTNLTITVLDASDPIDNGIKVVDGVATRVVEERETADGELVEVSRNYFAICNRTNSVHYFGEDVDIFTPGQPVSHDGSWLAGVNGAQAGIIMPGTILLGGKYFQEIAPGVAMDRAEIKSMTEVVETLAGTFENCLMTFETTPLDKKAKDFKLYAPGIGLIKDGDLTLKQVVPAP